MKTWQRVLMRAKLCGRCHATMSKGDPVLVITIGKVVCYRCVNCEGPAPPDLPAVIAYREPDPPRTFMSTGAAVADWKARAAREPGEEG